MLNTENLRPSFLKKALSNKNLEMLPSDHYLETISVFITNIQIKSLEKDENFFNQFLM